MFRIDFTFDTKGSTYEIVDSVKISEYGITYRTRGSPTDMTVLFIGLESFSIESVISPEMKAASQAYIDRHSDAHNKRR